MKLRNALAAILIVIGAATALSACGNSHGPDYLESAPSASVQE